MPIYYACSVSYCLSSSQSLTQDKWLCRRTAVALAWVPAVLLVGWFAVASARGQNSDGQAETANSRPRAFFIREYRVKGAHALSKLEIETAVYPFLGPERTEDDVKKACGALEKLYHDKGYGAAAVQYQPQIGKGGVVFLQVAEGTVARLRVKGAQYFSPSDIKAAAPSLQEGKPLNFDEVNKDIVALNQLPDRKVLPSLKPGQEPGTFDVDLDVQDKAPVHGSVEVNNRNSPNTKPLRLNLSVSDSNLWQAGHGLGINYQVAPQRRQDSEVFSGYYLARFKGLERTSFLVQVTKQNSNISTLGGTTVAGPGQTIDFSTSIALPNGKDWSTGKDWTEFSHSISFGITYKHYQQTITTPGSTETEGAAKIVTPITYYPLHVDYTATFLNLIGKESTTELNVGVNFHFRGVGSSPSEFDLNRYGSDGSFVYFRGDLSHTQELWWGFEGFGKVSGQLSNQPLVSSEQISGGGLSTVRGYMEAQAVGDDGVFGTLELRTPSVLSWLGGVPTKKPADAKAGDAKPSDTDKSAATSAEKQPYDWRFHVFGDAGGLTLHDSLPKQKHRFGMVSVGAGTRFNYGDFGSASLDAGYPIYTLGRTKAQDWRLTFRAGLNF